MEYGLAREELKHYVGDAFKNGLPAVYVVSNRNESDVLKVGLVRYGDLQRRMGNFLTWSRGFLIHYVLYTDTILNVNALETEIHNLLVEHNHKRIQFEPNIYFKKLSEWFKVKPSQIEKLFEKITTPLVKVLKLYPTSKYFHKRKQRHSNSNHIKELKIKKKQEVKNSYYTRGGRDKRKFSNKKTFPVYVSGLGLVETSFK